MKIELRPYMEVNDFFSRFGFSLYLSNSFANSEKWFIEYQNAGFSFVFSSLNINEEEKGDEKIRHIVTKCQREGLTLIVDINQDSLKRYGNEGIKKLGIKALRIDDGITIEAMKSLSEDFLLVLNASTLSDDFLRKMMDVGIEKTKVLACHNYYPKPYTGLGGSSVRDLNSRLHSCGIKVITFIPGDNKRFPLFEGLPTVEEHRALPPIQAALDCMMYCESDYVCIGDNALSSASLERFSYLTKGIIALSAQVPKQLKEMHFENRIDASDYVIRASHSRNQLKGYVIQGPAKHRKRGDIVLANEQFLRYQSELEICLVDLPQDDRQMVVGHVHESDIPLLDFVKHPFHFTFI
ncbi:TPA: DUF871 family protein [Streptococcus suis]|nr:DUF871 family protein [Streptococcus suis]